MVFRGTFEHTLDAKNRLTVPSRFRAALADGVVLVRSVDLKPCVSIWRGEDFAEFSRRALDAHPPMSSLRSDLERFFFGNSLDSELDAAGRLMIPAAFCEECELRRDVVVVGVGERLEVWSPDTWKAHQGELRTSVAEVTARADALA